MMNDLMVERGKRARINKQPTGRKPKMAIAFLSFRRGWVEEEGLPLGRERRGVRWV